MVIAKRPTATTGMVIALVVLSFVLMGLIVWKVQDKRLAEQAADKQKIAEINTFDQCVAAGNPVMESYPEQCASGGKTFTRVIEEDPAPDNLNVFTTVVNSGKGSFDITIPDGWNLIKDAQADYIVIPGDKQPVVQPGTKPVVATSDGYGSDGPSVFAVLVNDVFDLSLPQGTETAFAIGKADTLLEGKRYSYIYEEDQESDGLGGGRLKGDRDYTYIFNLKDGRQLRAWYNVYGSDPTNNIATVEDVLRTIVIK